MTGNGINGNGKTITAWVTIAVTVIVVFATQAISADVRNRERDQCQDDKISSLQSDIREINTRLGYIAEDVSEQKIASTKILNMLTDIKNGG